MLDADLPREAWEELLLLALRGQARDDVFKFGEYVFDVKPAPHHREMVEFIEECVRLGQNGVILEPRGHAKTTWGNTIWLSHHIARHRDIRVGLISNTAKQAYDFSRAIRWTFEGADRFREVFGDLTSGSPKLTDASWILPDTKTAATKDLTLYAQGAGGAIISKRFDLILCDDILDEENTINIEQQEKIETWFWKTLKPCLTPDGVIIVLGTRWAEGDLYEKLITPIEKGGKGWRHLIKSALTTDEHGDLVALWPDLWPVHKLLQERLDMGSPLFACSYQNDISGLMAGNLFHRPPDDYYFTTLPEGHRYTIRMGVDLASSERERADYTARVTTAEDEQGNFFVLSSVRDKRESHHAEFVYDGWAAHPHMSLVIAESQQFQSTLIKTVMEQYPRIPIEGRKSDVDKVTRARAVAAKYEAHKVFHHVSLKGSEFETELLSFPKGHDDQVDALGFSMDLTRSGVFFGSVWR